MEWLMTARIPPELRANRQRIPIITTFSSLLTRPCSFRRLSMFTALPSTHMSAAEWVGPVWLGATSFYYDIRTKKTAKSAVFVGKQMVHRPTQDLSIILQHYCLSLVFPSLCVFILCNTHFNPSSTSITMQNRSCFAWNCVCYWINAHFSTYPRHPMLFCVW